MLLIRAWFWLAAEATDPAEKLRCLDEILLLDPDNKRANAAMQGVVQAYSRVTYLHPANAEELANIAEETGAEVLRGRLRYPSKSGGWQLGDIDLSEHLAKYRDRSLTVIIAPTGLAEAAKGLGKQQEHDALFRKVDDVVKSQWEDIE